MNLWKKEKDENLTPVQARHKRENALLRTYFVSLFSLVLCCTMFFGTTMAWFTSDVTSGSNVITAGTIAAKLYRVVDPTENTDVQLMTMPLPAEENEDGQLYIDLADPQYVNYQPFGINPLAPTYSTEATFCVENTGDLPFSYQVYLNMEVEEEESKGTLTEEEVIFSLAEDEDPVTMEDLAGYFNVYVNGSETPIGTMADMIAIEDGERIPVYSSERGEGTESMIVPLYPESVIREDNENVLASSETFTIKIELDEKATAEIMGMQLTFNIRLVANQLLAENTEAEEASVQN